MWQKAAVASKVGKVAVRLKRLDEVEGAHAGDRLRFRLRPSQASQGRLGGAPMQDSLAAAAVHCCS